MTDIFNMLITFGTIKGYKTYGFAVFFKDIPAFFGIFTGII